jgi:phosphoribosylformylglycinamidine cyclo-ligase
VVGAGDDRVLNKMGAFGSVVQGHFPGYREPVLVLKTEEPGTKQHLAFDTGLWRGIGYDTVNHLLNDIAVMGATPLYIQDCIICEEPNPEVIGGLVADMADACRRQGCVLTGGETTVQPGAVGKGRYFLSVSGVGIAERSEVIDGRAIGPEDVILAIESNGLHTNGYSLVRRLLDDTPDLADEPVGDVSFLEAILAPHLCYVGIIRRLLEVGGVHGLAHITGGGIADNLVRILPADTNAEIDLGAIRPSTLFDVVRSRAGSTDEEMLRTFNLGVGLVAVVEESQVAACIDAAAGARVQAWPVGKAARGSGEVRFRGAVSWG